MAENKKIFVIQESDKVYEVLYPFIRNAAYQVPGEVEILRINDIPSFGKTVLEKLYDTIETADLIICDITPSNPNVMYELGYSHGLRKPVILISRKSDYIPFDIRGIRTLIYDINNYENSKEFEDQLASTINLAIKNPLEFSHRQSPDPSKNSVFICYSHKDRDFLDRLMVHLRPLEKEGLIDLWVDKKIAVGDRWKNEIEDALTKAGVVIMLISADFLASDFIVNDELPPILRKVEVQGTKIIPVVLKHCRFKRDDKLNIFQSINDPDQPLSILPQSGQESIFDRISETVESFIVR